MVLFEQHSWINAGILDHQKASKKYKTVAYIIKDN